MLAAGSCIDNNLTSVNAAAAAAADDEDDDDDDDKLTRAKLIWPAISSVSSDAAYSKRISECYQQITTHKEAKQPHKKFKVDWLGVYIPIYPSSLRPW